MRLAATTLAFAASCAPALASDTKDYSVTRSITVDASADAVWNMIGDFCDLDDWHPAFVACSVKSIDGSVHRVLTLDGGGDFVEKLIAVEPGLSYTYAIVEGPVPLEDYVGTMSITRGDRVEITWSSRFKSDDPEMEALVGGVYDGGLAALSERLSQ